MLYMHLLKEGANCTERTLTWCGERVKFVVPTVVGVWCYRAAIDPFLALVF